MLHAFIMKAADQYNRPFRFITDLLQLNNPNLFLIQVDEYNQFCVEDKQALDEFQDDLRKFICQHALKQELL